MRKSRTIISARELAALLQLVHERGHDASVAVVEHGTRAEALDEVEVARGRRGHNIVAGGNGELDCGSADARAAAPDEQRLVGRGGLGARQRQRQGEPGNCLESVLFLESRGVVRGA